MHQLHISNLLLAASLFFLACPGETDLETGAQCFDGLDNNKNGLIDCQEVGCKNFAACGGTVDAGIFDAAPSDSSSPYDLGNSSVDLPPGPNCSDGTAPNTCSSHQPFFCNVKRELVQACDTCGCLGSAACNKSTQKCGPSTIYLYSKADTYVEEAHPDTNYNDQIALHVGKENGTLIEFYLKFDLSTLASSANINMAVLRLVPFASNYNSMKIQISLLGTNWQDSTVTWNTKPGPTGSKAIVFDADSGSSLLERDITELIRDCHKVPTSCYGLRVAYSSSTNASLIKSYYAYDNNTDHNPQLKIDFAY